MSSPRTVLTGKASADLFEIGEEHSELSFRIHGGGIQAVTDRAALLGELLIATNVEQVQLSGGVNLGVTPNGNLRWSLAVGLNDNTAALSFILGYLQFFR